MLLNLDGVTWRAAPQPLRFVGEQRYQRSDGSPARFSYGRHGMAS